jgi:DNA repair protein RadC
MQHYRTMSDIALLSSVIGIEATKNRYQGQLRPLFEANGETAFTDLAPLLAARELLVRWMAEELTKKDALCSPTDVKQFLVTVFAGQGYESFVTLYLDVQHRLICAEESFRGTLTHTAVYPREIAKAALTHNAACVLFAHNHPSGQAEPSRADELLTQSLKQALQLVDVRVLDHLVIGGNSAVSFVERGML